MSMQDGFVEQRFPAPDGLTLGARVYGDGLDGALPAICLPGLTRNARDFHELALHLSRNARRPHTVVAFDYRGRGRSDRDPDWTNYNLPTETADVLAGLAALGLGRGAFIGTSRGGLIIHLLAALRPEILKAVVLNDVGPVVEGAGLARIRAFMREAPQPGSFDEAAAVLKQANGPAFPALGAADWARMARALYRDEDGRPVADHDPKLLETLTGIDFDTPLPTLWPQFAALEALPVLAIRGEHSLVLSAGTLAEMARRHPRLEAITVAGQGHAPLLETGDLPLHIESFLERADAAAR